MQCLWSLREAWTRTIHVRVQLMKSAVTSGLVGERNLLCWKYPRRRYYHLNVVLKVEWTTHIYVPQDNPRIRKQM